MRPNQPIAFFFFFKISFSKKPPVEMKFIIGGCSAIWPRDKVNTWRRGEDAQTRAINSGITICYYYHVGVVHRAREYF